MKRILLTGSTGFVGKNLLEKLQEKYEILAPDRHSLNLLDSDSVFAYIRKNNFDIIIHAANPSPLRSNDNPDMMLMEMLTQFFSILRSKDYFGKLLYFGSGAEFDKSQDISNVSEDDIGKRLPLTQYGLAKYAMNQFARASDNIYNLRLFGCFGPYEYWPTCFISNAICRTLFDMPITIRQNVYFDYMFVDDIIPVVKWLINSDPEYRDFNVCSGKKIDLLTLANIVRQIYGKETDIIVAKKGLNKEYTASNARLKKQFQGFSITPIETAVKMLYLWYQGNRQIINAEKIQA